MGTDVPRYSSDSDNRARFASLSFHLALAVLTGTVGEVALDVFLICRHTSRERVDRVS